MEFYEKLTFARKAKGFSQEDLAERLDISRQAISKWENGTAQPEMLNIIKLCEVLEITPNELFGYESVPAEIPKKSEDPGTKRIRAIIIIFVIAAAALVNIAFIKAILPEQPEPQIEYIISEFTAGSFNWEFIKNVGSNKQMEVSFSPSISGSDCVFSLSLSYDGKSFSVPAEYSNGVCTATFSVPYYTRVAVTACMEQGGFTHTYPLGIFDNADVDGITYYPIE